MEPIEPYLCDVCYDEPKNKVILECKHEICVKCFLELKPNSGYRCHMCRRSYKFKRIINIQEEESPLKKLFIDRFPDAQILFLKVAHKEEKVTIHYVLLFTQDIPSSDIESLIEKHFLTYYPGTSEEQPDFRRILKNGNVEDSYLFTMNVDFYLQDYYDIILKRIVKA